MDELESIEDGVQADLFEEYLCRRECGLSQEVQWLAQHPEHAEEFTALGAICDRLAAVPLTPSQRFRQRQQVQERCQPAVMDIRGIATVMGVEDHTPDHMEEQLSTN